MGQFGYATYYGDSVFDFLQEVNETPKEITQEDADIILRNVWEPKNQGSHFDRLGVVVWVIIHGLIVPIDKLKKALEYANEELHPDNLNDWGEREKRAKMLAIEMNDIRHALVSRGKGRVRPEDIEPEPKPKCPEDIEPEPQPEPKPKCPEVITLPAHNIVVTLKEYGVGTITSDINEVCEYCKDPDCMMNCFEFGEACIDRDFEVAEQKNDERVDFLATRAATNTLESFILACACSGVDIKDLAFIEAVETASDAISKANFVGE